MTDTERDPLLPYTLPRGHGLRCMFCSGEAHTQYAEFRFCLKCTSYVIIATSHDGTFSEKLAAGLRERKRILDLVVVSQRINEWRETLGDE